jgi:DNA adenine methylase
MKARGAGSGLLPRPVVKWAGGKTQVLQELTSRLPGAGFSGYVEPFVGGGALFFELYRRGLLTGKRVLLSDNNPELMHVYSVIRDDNALFELLALLSGYPNTEGFFYTLRAKAPTEAAERAARMIYLNRTCYNGLYRVNREGRFNVPFGRYANPKIRDPEALLAASIALRGVCLREGDFEPAAEEAAAGDLVYFDPPFHPVSATSRFTAYTRDAFGTEEQTRLAAVFRRLDGRGCLLMLSNSDSPFVRELYSGFEIRCIPASRVINSRGDRRGPVGELVVTNYPQPPSTFPQPPSTVPADPATVPDA